MTRIQSFHDRMKTLKKKLMRYRYRKGPKRDALLAKKKALLEERRIYIRDGKRKRLAFKHRKKLLETKIRVGGAPSRKPGPGMLAKMENYVRWRIKAPLTRERLYRQMVERLRIVMKKLQTAKGEELINYRIELQYYRTRIQQSRHLYEAPEY